MSVIPQRSSLPWNEFPSSKVGLPDLLPLARQKLPNLTLSGLSASPADCPFSVDNELYISFVSAKINLSGNRSKNMKNIYSSASKLVFLMMTVAVIAGLFTGKIDPKDFMVLASMAFAFYFANKGETSGEVPYAGK